MKHTHHLPEFCGLSIEVPSGIEFRFDNAVEVVE